MEERYYECECCGMEFEDDGDLIDGLCEPCHDQQMEIWEYERREQERNYYRDCL